MNPEQKVDVLRAACCVAGIDGQSTDDETKLIAKLAKDVGCGKASVNAMMDRAKTDPEFHKQQFELLKEDPKETIVTLIEVAMADGVVSDAETTVLRNLANNLDVPEPVFDELMVKVQTMLKNR